MKVREHFINNKNIKIYDEVFSFGEMQSIYGYAFNSLYKPSRRALNYPGVDVKYAPTLKCSLSLSDMLKFSFFQSKWIRSLFKENNLRVSSAYINLCTASDTYTFHTDCEQHEIPTILAYLNMQWEPSWEGETHFSDEQGRDVLFSAGFVPGRVILFNSSIPHKSSQPGPMADNYRYVLAVKLATKEYKQYWGSSFAPDDFFFDTDVAVNPKENRAVSFLREKTAHIPHSGTSFFDHLFGTFCVLKKFQCDEDTCLAGLFHAIYGTEYFRNSPHIEEDKIIKLIGPAANELVKLFAVENRNNAVLNNLFNVDKQTHLNLLYILYANLVEQAHRMDFDLSFVASVRNKIDEITETMEIK